MPRVSKTYTPAWYNSLTEKQKTRAASDLANLCSPLEEASTLRGLLEETESYTITADGGKVVAFKIGDLACPSGGEDPSNIGGRKRRKTKKTRRRRQKLSRKKVWSSS